MGERTSWRKAVSKWADPVEQASRDLVRMCSQATATPIAEAPDREPVRLSGQLRTVTLQPRGGAPSLEAELVDGTGSVLIVWLGRRTIGGIDAGTRVSVEGRIGLRNNTRVMYNPRYELRP